jgi:hypothetical protein
VLAERVACSEDAVAVVARVARVRHVLQGYNSFSNHTKPHRAEPNQTILSKKTSLTKPKKRKVSQTEANEISKLNLAKHKVKAYLSKPSHKNKETPSQTRENRTTRAEF